MIKSAAVRVSELSPAQKLCVQFVKLVAKKSLRLNAGRIVVDPTVVTLFEKLVKEYSFEHLAGALDWSFTDDFWAPKFNLTSWEKHYAKIMSDYAPQVLKAKKVSGLLPRYCVHARKHQGSEFCNLCHVEAGLPWPHVNPNECLCPKDGPKAVVLERKKPNPIGNSPVK